MGRISIVKKKKFKEKNTYYKNFVFFLVWIFGAVYLLIDFGFFYSEKEIYERFTTRNLIGNASQRYAISMEKFIVEYFGKSGLMIALIIILFLGIVALFEEIAEYKRSQHKFYLYQQGLIKNIFDIYDDKQPSSLQLFKSFFNRRKNYRIKYPDRKQIKSLNKEMDEYFKTVKK